MGDPAIAKIAVIQITICPSRLPTYFQSTIFGSTCKSPDLLEATKD
jgi:hypothetical protein